jgi:uncharacterized membrane protein
MKTDNQIKTVWRLGLAGLVVVYIALRWWRLTDSCLWFDEIFSVHAAEHGWDGLFSFVAQDLIHPPLFYVFLKVWILLGGENLFWLRYFPVFFAIVAIFPFMLLCQELKLPIQTTVLAFALFAINGSLIKYAQEVRMYSLLMCLAIFSWWLFARYFNQNKGLIWLLVINVLMVNTHYFGWLVVLTELLVIGLLKRSNLKQLLIIFLVICLSFVPWVLALWQAMKINADVGQNIGWMNRPTVSALFQFIFDLFEPIYFQQSSTDQNAVFLITLPIVLISLAAIVIWFQDWKTKTPDEKQTAFLLIILAATPVILAFISSWIAPYSIWGTRHLLIVFAPFVILLSLILLKIRLKQLKYAAVLVIFLLSGLAFTIQARRESPVFIWCAWENLAANLRNSEKPAKLYVFEDLVAYHFWFVLRDSEKKPQVIKVNDVMPEDKAYFLPRGFDEIQVINQNEINGERFFIAFRDQKWDLTKPPLKNLIESGYQIGEPKLFEKQGVKAFLAEVSKRP